MLRFDIIFSTIGVSFRFVRRETFRINNLYFLRIQSEANFYKEHTLCRDFHLALTTSQHHNTLQQQSTIINTLKAIIITPPNHQNVGI